MLTSYLGNAKIGIVENSLELLSREVEGKGPVKPGNRYKNYYGANSCSDSAR
jgi:hypothetical protein